MDLTAAATADAKRRAHIGFVVAMFMIRGVVSDARFLFIRTAVAICAGISRQTGEQDCQYVAKCFQQTKGMFKIRAIGLQKRLF
jgi:hypothetical protein